MTRLLQTTLDWLGSHTGLLLIAALLVVLGVWAFIGIADEVKEGGTQRFDEWVVRSLRKSGDPTRMIGPAWLGEVARDITGLGGVAVLSLVTAAVVGFLWRSSRAAFPASGTPSPRASWALLCWIAARTLQRRGAVEQDIAAPPTSEGGEPRWDAAGG